jgi:hypothetical protein
MVCNKCFRSFDELVVCNEECRICHGTWAKTAASKQEQTPCSKLAISDMPENDGDGPPSLKLAIFTEWR